MISLNLASKLKAAGLLWQATTNDFFAIPDRGMDDRLFVIADMQAQLAVFRGWPAITFHGTAEWALDYILTTEVVWMPREGQLRDELLVLLPGDAGNELCLKVHGDSYVCRIPWRGEAKRFEASTAGDAYGNALLFVLENRRST